MSSEELNEVFEDNTQLPPEEWEKKLKDNEKTVQLNAEAEANAEAEQETAAPAEEAPALAEEESVQVEEPAPHEATLFGQEPLSGNKKPGGFFAYALLACFVLSIVCGVYLAVKPAMTCPKQDAPGKPSLDLKGAFASARQEPGIAWIKVRGVIAESNDSGPFTASSGASSIAKKIRQAAADKNVKAIVMDINSPGGTVASVQNIYSELNAAKQKGKKVVSLFRDVAASGGFYIAMASDKIMAEPGTITGSVGVIMQTSNVQGLLEKIGVTVTPVTSGKYKDIGSMYRPMTDAEKAILQDMVSDTYGQFKAAVASGRPNVKPEVLAEYTDGRVFTGQRAYDTGFIDALGGEEEARLLAGELAGLEDPKIITQKTDNLRDFIISFGSTMENKTLAKQLETLSTPSVSYLWMN